jgi:hypothetical protein
MTRDDVLKGIQRDIEVPNTGEVNFPEVVRLLNRELPYLIFSGRAYAEMQAVRRLVEGIQQKTVPATVDLIQRLHARCLLLIAIGVSRSFSIKGGTNLGGEYIRDGITEEEMESVIAEVLGPVIAA